MQKVSAICTNYYMRRNPRVKSNIITILAVIASVLALGLACLLLFSLSACGREPKEEVSDEKPVIYLYPEQETDGESSFLSST